jgi:hypothetical protein
MEVLELKEKIKFEIEEIGDVKSLENWYSMLASHNQWNKLDSKTQLGIVDMAKNPQNNNWVPHNEVMKKFEKWRLK